MDYLPDGSKHQPDQKFEIQLGHMGGSMLSMPDQTKEEFLAFAQSICIFSDLDISMVRERFK